MARKRFWERMEFSIKNRLSFYERMAALIEQGKRPLDAMESMLEQFNRAEVKNSQKRFLEKVIAEFPESKDSIETALSSYIPPGESMIISAGVRSNQVVEGFKSAAELTERLAEFKAMAISKLVYPVVLYLMGIALFIGGYYMLDMYVAFKDPTAWDYWSRTFYYTGQYMVQNWGFLLSLMAGFIGLMYYLVTAVPNNPALYQAYRKYRPLADKFPPFSVYRFYTAFSFLVALAGLLRASMPPREALTQISADASPYLLEHIRDMMDALITQSPGDAVTGTKLMDMDQQMSIAIIAQTTDFSNAVQVASARSMQHAERQLSAALNLISVGGWIFSGIAICWMAMSQFSVVLTLQ